MRSIITWVLSAGCTALSAISLAGIAITPHPGYPKPNYFSGTNSRAFFRAVGTAPHVHIQKIEIYLNDIKTVSDHYPPPPTQGEVDPAAEAAIMFDSHYFSYSTSGILPIRVKCVVEAVTATGQVETFEEEYENPIPARNSAALLSLEDIEAAASPVGIVHSQLHSIGYPDTMTYSWGWTHSTFRSKMDGSNFLFYAGHGNPTNISDGQRKFTVDGYFWQGDSIFANEDVDPSNPHILGMRVDQVGFDQLPPFNSSGKPPLNLAIQFACNALFPNGTTPFVSYLFPATNGYGTFLENQAFLSWDMNVPVSDLGLLAQEVSFWLKRGFDIEFAKQKMEQVNLTLFLEKSFIKGDGSSRLRQVYDPGSSVKRFWRPISLP